MRQQIRIAVLGLGWMGQAHSRSARRIPTHFPDRSYDPRLVVCADPVAERRQQALEDFGFERAVEDWHDAVVADDVDAVWVTAPNALHLPMIEAATAAGKAVFSEKPIGGKPEHAVAALQAARSSGVATGVGYCYLWSPWSSTPGTSSPAGSWGRSPTTADDSCRCTGATRSVC